MRPIYFESRRIADLPVYLWSPWQAATRGQLQKWRDRGGVLIDASGMARDDDHVTDVVLLLECPMTPRYVELALQRVEEYGVIPRPHTWLGHEQTIDMRAPEEERLRLLWDICAGQRITTDQLAEYSGLPKSTVLFQRAVFKPVDEWEMKVRLAPTAPGLLPAWEWLGKGRTETKRVVNEAGHAIALKEMARLGHITLTRFNRFPTAEPDWKKHNKRREKAIADLHRVQSLVESLPDHLQA